MLLVLCGERERERETTAESRKERGERDLERDLNFYGPKTQNSAFGKCRLKKQQHSNAEHRHSPYELEIVGAKRLVEKRGEVLRESTSLLFLLISG